MLMNKICFQLKNPEAANTMLRASVDVLPEVLMTKAFEDSRTIEVEFDENDISNERASQARVLHQIISTIGEWKIVGPRCIGHGYANKKHHSEDYAHMELVDTPAFGPMWRCFQIWCQETLGYFDCHHMRFQDFHSLVQKGSINSSKKHPYLTDTITKNIRQAAKTFGFGDQQRSLEVMASRNKTLLEKVQNLQKEIDERSMQLSDVKIQLADLEILPKVSDELFRFLASINFQDQSIKDQKEFLRLMSQLKAELKRVGIGSND